MIVLYVDDSKDDAFWFGRALRKISAPTEWRHLFGTQEAKCYLRGEGMFSQREAFPFPDLVVTDAKMTDGTGVQLVQWIRSQPEFKSLPFCLFTEVEEHIRRQLGNELTATVCLFSKPSDPADWPPIVKQMLEWHSKSN